MSAGLHRYIVHKKIKSILSQVNFALNRNPFIEHSPHRDFYIPSGHEAVITITADFELAWAPRYSKIAQIKQGYAEFLARRERRNLPCILDLCERYHIPVTWATVGHLFLPACKRNNGTAHAEIPAVPPYNDTYWDFNGDDWFEFDPCTDYKTAPEWYAPDLIRKILASKIEHEIGCHTFSHINCRDGICPPELFRSEIFLCQKEAEKLGVVLKSFVHPGHTIGNLDVLARLGFSSFQTDSGNILGYPVKHANGLWELKRTYEFVYRKEWSVGYHIYRYKKIIDRAIKHQAVCNFWFHPSLPELFVDIMMPEIFNYIQTRIHRIYLNTVSNYTEYLHEKG